LRWLRDHKEITFTFIEQKSHSDFEDFSAADSPVPLCKEKSSIDERNFPSRNIKVISLRALSQSLFILFLCIGACLFGAVVAEEKSDYVTIPSGTVIPEDYFIAAENIELLGTVEGDAYIAGMQVFIDGEITGDLLIAAASATIAGKVHGNIRFFGGQATLSGEVGKNVSMVGGSLQLLPSSSISGNLAAVVGTLELDDSIDGSASVAASNLRVSGHIGKDLSAAAGRLRLTSKAVIEGDLEYRGNEAAAIDPMAIIRGKIIQHPTLLKKYFHGRFLHGLLVGTKFLALFMNFLFTFVVGIFLIRMFPKNLQAGLDALNKHPLKALGLGVVLLIALPLASIILLMSVLGAPFAVALLAINILTFYTAKIFSVSWASNYLAEKVKWRAGPIIIFACGLVVYYALTTIPKVGFFISLAALLFGLGAALLARTQRHFFRK